MSPITCVFIISWMRNSEMYDSWPNASLGVLTGTFFVGRMFEKSLFVISHSYSHLNSNCFYSLKGPTCSLLRRAAPSAEFSVDRTRHLMSFLTMLGPSPDWNVGLSAEDLCTKECGWAQKVVQDLIPWDAGTDSGVTYEVSIRPYTTHLDIITNLKHSNLCNLLLNMQTELFFIFYHICNCVMII